MPAGRAAARPALEFACAYPGRVRTLTLVEPAAYWILEQLGERDEVVDELNAFVQPLYGHQVTPDDLATFLEYAGFVRDRKEASSHPNWERWLPHRMALSWQSEEVDHPDRRVDDLVGVSCPTLLVKGDRHRRLAQTGGRRPGRVAAAGQGGGARGRPCEPHPDAWTPSLRPSRIIWRPER